MLQWFNRNERILLVLFWVSQALLHYVFNTLTVLDDIARNQLPFASWKPWVWEGSSQLLLLLLVPVVWWADRQVPLRYTGWPWRLAAHAGFSALFSLLHVGGMVALRQAIYALQGEHYGFGDWGHELLYEYRKDVFSYSGLLMTFYLYRFVLSRLRGEAHPIVSGEDQAGDPAREAAAPAERFLVRKFGKEFLVAASDIDWVEACGNYMNLHVGERVYPLRATMANMETRLDPKLFVRVHRSVMLNLDRIREIRPQESGDAEALLSSGTVVPISRRYREQLRALVQG